MASLMIVAGEVLPKEGAKGENCLCAFDEFAAQFRYLAVCRTGKSEKSPFSPIRFRRFRR